MSDIPILSVAVVLFQHVTSSIELLGSAGVNDAWQFISKFPGVPRPKTLFEIDYLADTLDPIRQDSGPRVLPTKTFSEVEGKQFDIILVPGGFGADPERVSESTMHFLKTQGSKAKYILSVCTGSWLLAGAGLLEGKRATTNKFLFKQVKEKTSSAIQWVPKARWVVDGNIWTGSGVTAGQDMGLEFLKTVAGEEFATLSQKLIELRATDAEDDEFAAICGLV